MSYDLYVWSAPRELTADEAAARITAWTASGGDPASSPFEPTTDIGWFVRELQADAPALQIVSDAVPSGSRTPIWMSSTDEPPARLVAIHLSEDDAREDIETIQSLAMKYDLIVFDPQTHRLRTPLAEMAEYASATFWPDGAIRAAIAGVVGLAISLVAWLLAIPILSLIGIVIGGFLVLLSVLTFAYEGRKAVTRRRS